MLVNNDFPVLGISFQPNAADIGILHADRDLFYFGPGKARGAVLYIPGRGPLIGRAVQITAVNSPNYLREFNNNDWDVYHYYAPPEPHGFIERLTTDKDVVGAITRAVNSLADRGYQKVLLAGHSWGATLALYAASKLERVAVIATSPAFAFHDPPTKEDTDRGLSIVGLSLRAMADRQSRIAMAMLDEDPFNPDPQGRLRLAGTLLTVEGVPSLLIHPSGERLRGHFAAQSFDFALEYAGCLRDFIETDVVKRSASCETAR